jgi:shikimate dehydrogenase
MELGLLGKSLEHSFSKSYFEAKFEREKLLNHTYSNFELATIDKLPELIQKHPKLRGLNVTIPYKESVIPFLDDISDEANEVGAVNTILIKDGKLSGFNTDVFGFVNSIKPIIKPPSNALILGTGGAAKAIAFGLTQLGVTHKLVSRNPQKNELSYQEASKNLQSYSILIHTTPLGTFPNISAKPPIHLNKLSKNHLVYDLIYNPSKTLLLQEAEKFGATIKNGLEMLQLQANKSWLIWNES